MNAKMSADIKRYIFYIKDNPFEDMYKVAERFFDKKDKSKEEVNVVIPELILLRPTVRHTVEDIVEEFTGINIALSDSNFSSVVTLKRQGEVLKEIKDSEKRLIK